MKGVTPEPVNGEFVIGRRDYSAKQVGQVIIGRDRRDVGTGVSRTGQ
ncbi:hypothetical protein [Streptomyces tibetensis]